MLPHCPKCVSAAARCGRGHAQQSRRLGAEVSELRWVLGATRSGRVAGYRRDLGAARHAAGASLEARTSARVSVRTGIVYCARARVTWHDPYSPGAVRALRRRLVRRGRVVARRRGRLVLESIGSMEPLLGGSSFLRIASLTPHSRWIYAPNSAASCSIYCTSSPTVWRDHEHRGVALAFAVRTPQTPGRIRRRRRVTLVLRTRRPRASVAASSASHVRRAPRCARSIRQLQPLVEALLVAGFAAMPPGADDVTRRRYRCSPKPARHLATCCRRCSSFRRRLSAPASLSVAPHTMAPLESGTAPASPGTALSVAHTLAWPGLFGSPIVHSVHRSWACPTRVAN